MKRRFIYTILLFILIANFIPTFASDDGGGKSEALTLVESTPVDGSKSVALNTEIKLIFNKNVVNVTVKDNNSKCFNLLNSDNQRVSIDIVFADDQMEPDKKREIILKPKEDLIEGITYTVVVSPELQAKNGTTMGKEISFTFTTLISEKKEEVKEVTQQAKSEVKAEISQSPKASDTADINTNANTANIPTETAAKTVSETTVKSESSNDIARENNTADTSIINAEAYKMKSEEQTASTAFSSIYLWGIAVIAFAAVFAASRIRAKKRKL